MLITKERYTLNELYGKYSQHVSMIAEDTNNPLCIQDITDELPDHYDLIKQFKNAVLEHIFNGFIIYEKDNQAINFKLAVTRQNSKDLDICCAHPFAERHIEIGKTTLTLSLTNKNDRHGYDEKYNVASVNLFNTKHKNMPYKPISWMLANAGDPEILIIEENSCLINYDPFQQTKRRFKRLFVLHRLICNTNQMLVLFLKN